VCFKSVLKFLC